MSPTPQLALAHCIAGASQAMLPWLTRGTAPCACPAISTSSPRLQCGVTQAPTRQSARMYICCRLRSEEHTSELQSRRDLVCRLLLEKKKKKTIPAEIEKNKKITA